MFRCTYCSWGHCPAPVRARKAEEVLKGQLIEKKAATEAAEQAVAGAKPLSMNAYKVEIIKRLVERAILTQDD